MLKTANRFFLVTSFVLTLCFSVSAQGTKPQPNNSSTVAANTAAANKAAPPDREQDGFLGPVRRVKTEVAKLSNKGGKFVEGGRALLENSAYDMKGMKSEYAYFPSAVSAIDSTGRETYKYDEKGNISEMILFNTDGSLAKKELYTYDYDFLGNWTKMTTSVAVIEGGKLSYEPTEVTFRTISYYMDENVLKQMEAAQKVSPPANAASNTNASSTSSTQTQTTSQPTNTDSSSKPNDSNSNHVVGTPAPTQPGSGNSDNKATNTSSNVEKKATDSTNANKPENTNKTESGKTSDSSSQSANNTETIKAAPKMLRPISGGVLNGKAVTLPAPEYPEIAKRSRLSGLVSVEVVIDENGKVISAKATTGPAMLQQAAVNAALRAKFSSTLLSGQPVKVTGTINYNFSMQ